MCLEVLFLKEAIVYLKKILWDIFDELFKDLEVVSVVYNLIFVLEKDFLNIWFLNGVNGVGKIIIIGKIVYLVIKLDYKCLIVVADIFWVAVVE